MVWILSYQVGLFLNLRYTKIAISKRIFLHVQTLVLCPIIGLIESFPAFYAVIEFYISKLLKQSNLKFLDFYVVKK